MSEQDDDEDELERDIVREVEEAFATIAYPSDDRLLAYPDYYESKYVLEAFRGKHWRELSREMPPEHDLSLGLLSPEAFRFYLPAYLVAALLHQPEIGMFWEHTFSALTPPASKARRREWFLAYINPLDARQKAAIWRFIELYVQTERSYPNPNKDRALFFWQRITDTERTEGASSRGQQGAMVEPSQAMDWESAASEQDECELKVLEQDIAGEVEDAFATIPYPGDDRIADCSPESKKALGLEVFCSRHWRDLSLKVLSEHYYKLKFFSPEAFRFFLPAYLIAALLHAEETDSLRDYVFYDLTPPKEEGRSMDLFLANINLLDARQKAAIRRFVELWVKTATCYPDAIKERALASWRRITDR